MGGRRRREEKGLGCRREGERWGERLEGWERVSEGNGKEGGVLGGQRRRGRRGKGSGRGRV